ncbi:hypothetical protein D3C75_1274250 [compost metagenome]
MASVPALKFSCRYFCLDLAQTGGGESYDEPIAGSRGQKIARQPHLPGLSGRQLPGEPDDDSFRHLFCSGL